MDINNGAKTYIKEMTDRSKKSKIYKEFQLVGLELADILNDKSHKSLYMRIAKLHDKQSLLQMAKKISEMKNVKNMGAYFMKMLKLKK